MSLRLYGFEQKSINLKFGVGLLFLVIFSAFGFANVGAPMIDDSSVEDLASMSLEDLLNMEVGVETASKRSERNFDAPGIVSIITAREIKQFGANNLGELIDRVTGVYHIGTYFTPENIASFRGDSQPHYDHHVLLLLNGRPIRDSLKGGLNADIYLAFPIVSLKQIEVIRGPGSVLYGANAYSGVINMITKDFNEKFEVAVTGGSLDTKGVAFSLNGGKDRFKYQIAGDFNGNDGWDFEAVGETGQPTGFPKTEQNAGLTMFFEFGDWSLNTLVVNQRHAIWGGTPGGQGQRREANRIFSDLAWSHEWNDKVSTRANLTFNSLHLDPNGADNQSDDLLLELSSDFRISETLQMIVGFVANKTEGTWQSGNPNSPLIAPYDTTALSAYFQGDYRPTDKLKLIFGAQANKPDGKSTDLVPRLAMIYNLNQKSGFKLLHGEAFRSAAPVETDVSIFPFITGNPNLEPETVASTELQYFYEGGNYWLAATYFHSHQDGLIGRTFDPELGGITYKNLGSADFDGLEIEGKIAPSEKFFITCALSYQENEDDRGVEDFTSMPNTVVKLGLAYKFNDRFDLGMFDSFYGAANDVINKNPDRRAVNPSADAYHMITANLNYKPRSNMKFSLYGYNLLNEDAYIPEFVRNNINTIPLHTGVEVYGKFSMNF